MFVCYERSLFFFVFSFILFCFVLARLEVALHLNSRPSPKYLFAPERLKIYKLKVFNDLFSNLF